jgi:hypothetical protein
VNIWVVYGIIATVGVLAIAGIVVGSIFLWRRQVRRSLVGLVVRREAIRAAYRALESVFAALAAANSGEIAEFAVNRASVQRKSLEELQGRMAIQADELANIALPKRFWHAADLLMAASTKLRDEVARINQGPTPEAVLDGVGTIDVAGLRAAIATAGEELERLLHENRVEDPSVYGGGLYI